MKMKNIVAIALAVALTLGLTACNGLQDLVGGGTDSSGTNGASGSSESTEKTYVALNSILGSPSNSSNQNNLSGDFTFTAMLLTESEEMTLEDETDPYYIAAISRNADKYFFLNAKDVDTTLQAGDIVTIKGSIVGTIYQTENNAKVEFAEILAKSIKILPDPNVTADTSGKFPISSFSGTGVAEVTKAHAGETVMGDAVILYFNFENTGDSDATPRFSNVHFFQDDVSLISTTQPLSSDYSVDPSALNGMAPTSKTYAGKTDLYYITLATEYSDDSVTADGPIFVEMYDDDFNLTHSFELPLGTAASTPE